MHDLRWAILLAALAAGCLPAGAQSARETPPPADVAFKACAYESALNNLSFRINPTFFRSLVEKACAREIAALAAAHPDRASVPREQVDRIVGEYERTLVNMRQGTF